MSETPQEIPESAAETMPAPEVAKTFEPPKGFETKFRGLAYVRPTEGRFAGKFLVVDERYVK